MQARATTGETAVNDWKKSFLHKLKDAQQRCAEQFERSLDVVVKPAFDELVEFLKHNGFRSSCPLRDPGRRSYKLELAENAYVLLIFHYQGINEFELRSEIFVPGCEPALERHSHGLADLTDEWAGRAFQRALDAFVERLGAAGSQARSAAAAAV